MLTQLTSVQLPSSNTNTELVKLIIMSDLKSAEEVLKFLRIITKRQELRSEKEARRKQ
jgi:hypothetical protein